MTTMGEPVTGPPAAAELYFRQLLAGRDFAAGDRVARQMVNFAYLIGDRRTGEAVAVDPAWAPAELIDLLAADGMRLTGVLASHYHADHVGGSLFGRQVVGIEALLEVADVPVHVQRDEAEWVARATGVGRGALREHVSGDRITVGGASIECIHTPGHTPGSQCFLVEGMLVSGDTLFLDGCGRTDLPGSDPEAMYDSLVKRLGRVPDETILYPGHLYSAAPSATMGETRRHNYVFAPKTPEEWLAMFGG
jgi:glyoxylase-like metal-dependent hydrolase (beta-lactamase superfamily II)